MACNSGPDVNIGRLTGAGTLGLTAFFFADGDLRTGGSGFFITVGDGAGLVTGRAGAG